MGRHNIVFLSRESPIRCKLKNLVILIPFLLVITFVLYQFLTLLMESEDQNKYQKQQSKEITEINLRMKEEFDELATALERVINFMVLYVNDINLDAAFGTALCQSNLKAILNKFIDRNVISDAIEDVKSKIKKTKFIIDETGKRIDRMAKYYDIFAPIMTNSELWPFRIQQIEKPLLIEPQYWTWDNAYDKTFNNSPTTEGSDRCLTELVNSASKNNHKCYVSDYCEKIIYDQPFHESTGYNLTHRLIHYQFGRAVGCENWDELVDTMSWKYCSKIASENLAIANIYVPHYTRDLFVEQLLLCGMEGYKQLWKPKWTSAILRWQTNEGCFTLYYHEPKQRNKRDTNSIGVGDCDCHFTGLTTGALAMRMNWILEDYDIWSLL